MSATRQDTAGRTPRRGDVEAARIDCDIHPALTDTDVLLPYLDDHWREQVTSRGINGMEPMSYPQRLPLSCRPDWRLAKGKPGSDFGRLQTDALDAFGVSAAICNVLHGAQAAYDPYMAAAFCGAINDWLAHEWLARDPRLRASVVVPIQDTDLAVREIEKRSGDMRFVQVLLPSSGEALLGRRQFWPIYEAAQRHRFTVGVHPGSQYRQAPTSIGWPSYRYEYYQVEAQLAQSQILSLLYEGVFGKFPELKFAFMESGVSWLPPFLWRAVKTWRGVRVEVPWVERPPADLIREHVRLTVQPFDGPPDAASLDALIAQIGTPDMLLFASDYPHWQFDGDDPIPPGFAPDLVRRMVHDNPLATYPRLKETLQ